MKVVINGKTYPSLARAATILNVTESSVRHRIESKLVNWKEWYYESRPKQLKDLHTDRRLTPSKWINEAKPVIIKGQRYPSIRQASKMTQQTVSCIVKRLNSNLKRNFDYQFEDTPKKLEELITETKRSSFNAKSIGVRVDGVEYPSMRAACAVLGLEVSTVSRGLRNRSKGYEKWVVLPKQTPR